MLETRLSGPRVALRCRSSRANRDVSDKRRRADGTDGERKLGVRRPGSTQSGMWLRRRLVEAKYLQREWQSPLTQVGVSPKPPHRYGVSARQCHGYDAVAIEQVEAEADEAKGRLTNVPASVLRRNCGGGDKSWVRTGTTARHLRSDGNFARDAGTLERVLPFLYRDRRAVDYAAFGRSQRCVPILDALGRAREQQRARSPWSNGAGIAECGGTVVIWLSRPMAALNCDSNWHAMCRPMALRSLDFIAK